MKTKIALSVLILSIAAHAQWLQNISATVTSTSATVKWLTSPQTSSSVSYGTTTGYGNVAGVPGMSTSHAVTLPNLLPNQQYHFVATSADVTGAFVTSLDQTFTTPNTPPPPPPPPPPGQCTATKKNADYSVDAGSANTVNLRVLASPGDPIVLSAWCFPGCSAGALTLNGQVATQTTVSGLNDSDTGQGRLYYIESAATGGTPAAPATATWTVSGAHADIQISYIDFAVSPGCSFVHHIDSPLGTGSGQVTADTPSIANVGGDVLFDFTYISEHIDSVNSPWSCPKYTDQNAKHYETQTCEFDTTVNAVGYILSAPAGTISNNMSQNPSSFKKKWQGLITSFSLVGSQ